MSEENTMSTSLDKLIEDRRVLLEACKSFYFCPDCGGDFCFLATEGMENEVPEEGDKPMHCKERNLCRWANKFMIIRDSAIKQAETP